MPHPSQESGPASSSHLGSILDVALSDYKQNTGKDLLSPQLICWLDSVDGILAVLQGHVNMLEQLRDGDRGSKLMRWISSFGAYSLPNFWVILPTGLAWCVSGNELVATDAHSDVIVQAFPPAKVIFAGSVFSFLSVYSGYFSEILLIPKIL